MKKIVTITFLLLIVLSSCKKEEDKNEIEKAIPVRIVKVESKSTSIPIHSSGKLSSISETKLSFKTGGIVQHIFVEEGETVKRGQVLASLNLEEIQAKVNQAKVGFDKAERDFLRIEALYQDSVVTLEQFQNITSALEVAKANLQIANFNLNHSKIIAPTNGKILKRFVEENELVAPGTPVIILGRTGNTWIMRVGVTDKDIGKLKIGNKAKVKIDAFPNKLFDAIVTEIASAANPYNGTYEIELTIKTKVKKLISGMVANTEIFPDVRKKLKIIPVAALVNADGQQGSVFIPTENNTIAKKIKIEISSILNNSVVIKNGLDNIDKVITDGVEYLSDGERIRVIDTANFK